MRVHVVNALLAKKEIQIYQAKNDGCTPLFIACQDDRVKVINVLLARKEIQINQAQVRTMAIHHCSLRVRRIV